MSREEVAAALRNLQLSLDGLQRELEGAIRALPDTRREALPDALAGVRRRLARFTREQLAELDAFAEDVGMELPEDPDAAEGARPGLGPPNKFPLTCSVSEDSPLHYGGVQLKSFERRVSAMGGIPALGACVLPRMTPGQRPQLAATASPAAVEIMRGRLSGSDATPLRRASRAGAGSQEEEEEGSGPAPTPFVQLRSTAHKSAAPAPSPAGPLNTELAAAIARRMQRLSSASPDKGAAAAAVAAVACGGED